MLISVMKHQHYEARRRLGEMLHVQVKGMLELMLELMKFQLGKCVLEK